MVIELANTELANTAKYNLLSYDLDQHARSSLRTCFSKELIRWNW